MIKLLPTFLIAICSAVSAHLLIKANALRTITISNESIISTLTKTYFHPFFVIGALCFGISLLFYNKLLSTLNLNLTFPVFAGINFCLIIIGSHFFFKESITLKHGLGILLILLGVIILSTLPTKTS